MCDDNYELDNLEDFDFPGAEVRGYNILYPCDPVRQAEAMFSEDRETFRGTDPRPSTGSRDRPTSSFLLRILLFLLCLAFPPIWPLLWLLRSRRPR